MCVQTADDRVQEEKWEPTTEEKALLREEFISQMHQRFLDGKDKDFDYRSATPPSPLLLLHSTDTGWCISTHTTT